jgi:hypothetical protein
MTEQCPPLTDGELDLAFREGATDEEIEFKLRDLRRWSYIMRDPLGKVCAVGKGTRAECIENAFRIADEHAIDDFSTLENPADEARALNGAWRLVLWPPWLDLNPRFWAASSGVAMKTDLPGANRHPVTPWQLSQVTLRSWYVSAPSFDGQMVRSAADSSGLALLKKRR